MTDAHPAAPPAALPPHRRHTLHGAFGADRFGVLAERVARFFGTPKYIVGQTLMVITWIALNALAIGLRWDPYPFILLNLAFSTQAAYAAPLILLAQTRQADRDRVRDAELQAHREAQRRRDEAHEARQTEMLGAVRALTEQHTRLLEHDTALITRVAAIATEVRTALRADPSGDDPDRPTGPAA